MNGSLAATAEPSWLSGRGLLWLYLLVPLCTLRAPSSSSWGAGHWGYSGDPTQHTPENPHQREWVGAPSHAGAMPRSWGRLALPGLC